MYFLNAVLFSCLIAKTICDSDKILLKFKSDVDKVGRSFEDLIFDVVKKIVDDVSAYQIDGDYYNSEEKTTQHSITKKILDSVENTTQENTTEETTASNRWIKNSTHPVDIFHNRLKRSASVNSTPPHEAKSTTASPINSTCPTKLQSEETLGFRQMEDLKGEIKKLQDLVVLLRDQQKIISLLDQNLDGFQSDFSSRFGARDVLKILDYVNNRDTQDREGKFSSSANSFELVDIKNDLKKAIATLNKTREILAMERKKEVLLEKELRDQKLDINFLKTMMEKLYKTDVNFHRDSIANDILGAVRHLPKELPSHNVVKAMKEGGNARRVQEIEEKVRVGNEHNSKTSDLDDLERILHKLNQPKNADTESKTLDSQKEMGKEKEEESLIKQLKSLEKYLEHRKKHDINTHPNTESEIARKLQFAMKMMDEDKSRHLDEEIEVELQKLQEAIDNLRPKDDLINEIPFTYQPDDDNKRFQAMLKKIFSKSRKEQDEAERYQMMLNKFFYKENKREEDPVKQLQMLWDRMTSQGTKNGVDDPNIKEYDSLVKEITELRKQLASVKRSQMGNDNFYSNRDVYSYGYPGSYPRYFEYISVLYSQL